jgi:hypothetical protein
MKHNRGRLNDSTAPGYQVELSSATEIMLDDPKKKGQALRFCIKNPDRQLWLEALNTDDRRDWVTMLQGVVNGGEYEAY